MAKENTPDLETKVVEKPTKTTVVREKSQSVLPLVGIALVTLIVLGAVFCLGRYVGQNDAYCSATPFERGQRGVMMDRGFWR